MLKFEQYLADFTNTINIVDFIVGLIVAAVLTIILKLFYIKNATAVSNREKFASNFVPLALTTMLVISVVQASIALSLGLVGALSIVRFRAAIKEPEELTYLFLAIGIGLVAGANKPLLAICAMAVILPLIYFNRVFRSKKSNKSDLMFLNIRTTHFELSDLTARIDKQLSYIELKRVENKNDQLFASFIVRSDSVDQLNSLMQHLKEADPKIEISIVDQPSLIL